MNKILENLGDPSWWFTAVLVAIIAGVCSAYAKDFIGKVLSALSDKYRRRREQKIKREEEIIAAAVSDPTIFSMLLILTVISNLYFVAAFLLVFVFPIWGEGMNLKRELLIPLMLFVGIAAAWLGFLSQNHLRLSKKALHLYVKNKRESSKTDQPPT